MGVIKWVGGKLAAPITQRKRAYRDLRTGVGSSARAARRGFRLRAHVEPPVFPGTAEQDVDAIYRRWGQLSGAQRKVAWREFDHIMRILMKREAEASGARWSLEVPDPERPEIYAKAHKRARTALWMYAGLMSIPVALLPWHGDHFIYWLNLAAAAIILSPNVLRHFIVRAQVYHGGKVSVRQVFRPYPSQLPAGEQRDAHTTGSEDAPTTDGLIRSGTFPMISWLYGIQQEAAQ